MQSFCRTCFLQIPDTSQSVTLDHKSHKHQLIVCIPELDLRTFPDAKMCKECIEALDVAYKFKTKCQEVDGQITKPQFNVIQHSKVTQNSCLDKNICRTCHDFMDNNSCLAEKLFYKSKLMFCIPKMDLRVVLNINLCSNCHTILDKIYLFKTKCLDVEKNIREYLKLHNNVDFKDLSVWCNAFVKCEVDVLKDDEIKQEVDLISEDEQTEDVKEQIINATLISPKTLNYQNYKCIIDNIEHFLPNKSIKDRKTSKFENDIVQRHIHPLDGKLLNHSLCEYSAATKSNLKGGNYTRAGEKPFKCSLCDYSALQQSDLTIHIRTHTGEKPFKCSLCEYSAIKISSLNIHFRKHSGEKPYKCSLCDYSAAQNSDLKIHTRTHTGEKPFKCSLCEYSAIKKADLKMHIHTHTGEKPFKCSTCDYSTVKKSHLKIHAHIHTGKKPFKCSMCNYSAAQKSNLNKHMHIHTVEKPFKC